jgi:2-dehydro-3-deoxyphosphogluconate aldolase / (4S)-4-hydroxy-2-oxoglutarate aldolase
MGISIFNPGSLGGPASLKAPKGPFPYIPMIPTGGMRANTVAEWFSSGVVTVGVGRELYPPQITKEGKFDEITWREAEFVQVVKYARV